MKTSWLLMPALSLGLALGGCAVVPERDYGYTDDERDYVRETVIMAPASHIEYRAYPPAANTIWIDGYWNRIGRQQVWVPGYWARPPMHARPPQRYWRDDGGRRMEALRERERALAHERKREHARERRDRRWTQQGEFRQREPMQERPQHGSKARDEAPRRWEGERTRGEAREQLTRPQGERSPLAVGERPRFRAETHAVDQAGGPERSERAQREPREPREPRRELERGDDSGRDMRHQRRFPRTERE